MEYFKPLQKVDTAPFLKEIEDNEGAWLFNTERQEQIKAQSETQTIVLRSATIRDDIKAHENQESEWTELSERFPLARQYMEETALKLGGTLSRAVIVRLQPKGNVYLHIDYGSYYHIRKRYHLVLQSDKGSLMMSGGEKAIMREGELWWFDNSQHHQAMNNSDNWRIHFIFDVLPDRYKELGKNPLTPEEVSLKLAESKNKS